MTELSFIKGQKTPSEAAPSVELDITPVMNMFLILIPFLVSMAVFTQVSIIEFSLPPNVSAKLDASKGKPKLKTTVVVVRDHLKITLGDQVLDSIPNTKKGYDTGLLKQRLAGIRAEATVEEQAIVAVQDPIRFKYVVGVMDACREAGFEKIGLSSAPAAAEE